MDKTQYVTLKVDNDGLKNIMSYYENYQEDNDGEYVGFFAKKGKTTITAYIRKDKEEYKVLFVGPTALKEARIFNPLAMENAPKDKGPSQASWVVLTNQIGSDEVGTGDFFGPITVCAALVKSTDIDRLKELGVDDSKRLSDEQIRKLGPILIKEFKYSNLVLNNEKYNEVNEKGLNMNEMKAKMHNQVLLNLHKKYPSVKNIFVDQFCTEKAFYEYLEGTKEIVKGITFKTKGESYFPCVAVASIIARYSFLTNMDEINKKYGVEIPFGAAPKVTEFAKQFLNKFGKDELDKIVKKNFANYDEVVQIKLF